MIVEVIATTVADALAAEAGGADRLELVTALPEGGLTPSCGTIAEVVRAVALPVQVMIRPHSHTFCYSAEDVRTMRSDIRAVRDIAAASARPAQLGVVLGCLTHGGGIDTTVLEELLGEADGLDVTFHRAFDEVADQEAAYATLSRYAVIRRVLTSGGKPSALDAAGRIRRLVELSADSHVAILAGSGLTLDAVAGFAAETGVREVHFGSAVRRPSGMVGVVDPDRVRALRRALPRPQV